LTIGASAVALLTFSGCTPVSGPPTSGPPTSSAPTHTTSSAPSIFGQINGDFVFASGVGAWETTLTIAPDGSFTGHMHDTDMGATGPGYPNGTETVCDFSGHFRVISQINQYEYSLVLVDLAQQGTPNDQSFKDGTMYVVGTPYGVADGRIFTLYLPGHPVAALPDGYLSWVQGSGALDISATTLPFWGLYNNSQQQGFAGPR